MHSKPTQLLCRHLIKLLCKHPGCYMRGDRTAAVAAVERLHALAAEAARSEEDPSTSQPRAPAKAPKVQPSDPDNVPVKSVQIGADSTRTTRIAGNLEEK